MKTKLFLLIASGLTLLNFALPNENFADAADAIARCRGKHELESWKTEIFKDGNFQASFPGKTTKQVNVSEGGVKLVSYSVSGETPIAFSSGYVEPKGIQVTQETVEIFLEGVVDDGAITKRNTRMRDGRKYFLVEFKGTIQGRSAMTIEGNRIYFTTVISLKGEMNNEAADHFFDSFKIR